MATNQIILEQLRFDNFRYNLGYTEEDLDVLTDLVINVVSLEVNVVRNQMRKEAEAEYLEGERVGYELGYAAAKKNYSLTK